MLAQLGATTFEIAPFNAHEIAHDAGADHAEKAVMGRRPPLEFVGEATEQWTVSGKLFPSKFGGLGSLEGLHQQRRAGKPLPFVRGDGVPFGWVVITGVRARSQYLDTSGIGQVIEVEITVKRSDPPGAGSIFSIVSGLLG